MHIQRAVLVALSTASLATAAVIRRDVTHVVHERRNLHSTETWSKTERVDPAAVIPIRIGLRQQSLENAEQYILDVSDPSSPNYGRHWTAEEVANTFRPSKETNDRVVSWLQASGVSLDRISHSAGFNWIQFEGTIGEAETLFATKYHRFRNELTGNYHLACDEYSLPHDIQEHVDFVLPSVHLGAIQHNVKRELARTLEKSNVIASKTTTTSATPTFTGLTGTKDCNTIITIDCLRALYKFPAGTTAHAGNQLGIGEWDQYLNITDLHVYFKNLTSPQIPSNVVPEFISIDGGKRTYGTPDQFAGYVFESAIDFQTSYSIIYPQNTRWYAVGDGVNVNSVGTFNILLDALDASYCTYDGGDSPKYDPKYPDPRKGGYKGKLQCGGAPVSNVFSFSYGQEEVNLSPAYEERQCYEYMKLGLQGVSMIFSSGDSGVAQRYNAGFPNKCLLADSDKKSVNGTRFSPGFPQTCPYVTSVGGTDLLTKSINGGERAVSFPDGNMSFYSGGGFSNVFKLPSYQKSAVNTYLTKYPPGYGKNVFNQTGSRAYPDVSALSINIATVFNSTINNFGGGTSASAPIFAGIVTLLNEIRLGEGKKPLGFLNPFLYANPDAFNDITVGDNPGCGTKGFKCQPGWDPVTGLGSPNFPKLKAAVMKLQ